MMWTRTRALAAIRANLVGALLPVALWHCKAAPAQPVVAIGKNFTASTLGVDSSAVPPDSNGAVGPAHYVEFVNGRFSVFRKSDGVKVKTMTDLIFWSQAGVSIPGGWDVTDPRILFDPASQRWFCSQVDFDGTATVNSNRFLVGVSATADPTGTWKGVAIAGDAGGNNFADFPALGIDSVGIYLSGDLFDTNSNPVGPTLVSIPKSSLLAATPTSAGMTSFGVLNYGARGNILQPAVCLDGSGQGHVLAVASIGIDNFGNFVTNTSIVLSQMKNAGGPGKATLGNSIFLTVPPYTVPLNPLQPDGTTSLDDGDARISGNVYEVGGVLFAVHATQFGGRAAIRWYRVDALNQNVLETGTITDPAKDLYYPSIAANAAGTIVIAFNGSGTSTFPSSFAVVGSTVNGLTTFGQPILLSSGKASYQNTDTTGISRWGDYSSTTVDPVDPTRFWTIQEVASGASTWSTQVTELLTGTPDLLFSSTATNLVLSWSGTLFNLQTATNLAAPAWTTATQTFTTNNGVVTTQFPLTASAAFFRLQVP
jgi:hypothetical protein